MADPDLVYAFPAGFRRLAADADLSQYDLGVLERDAVVVDHKNAQLVRVQISLVRLNALPVRLSERHRHREDRAFALLALHFDVTVHQLHNALGDGHAEAGASVSACGRGVLLAEGFKDMRQVFLAHADAGVADHEFQRRLPVKMRPLLDHKTYRAPFGRELDGIAQDVDQHLLELHDVADIIIIDAARDPAVVAQTFVPALAADHGVDLLKALGKGELLLLDRHAPGFDAAHIQNVVDDPQQMLRGGADLLQVFLHLVAGRGIVHGDVVQTDDGVHRRADLMAHVGEERGFRTVGMLRRSERVLQRLSAFGQLRLLDLFPGDSLFQTSAVLLLLILRHKAVKEAGSQHIAHGIKRQQWIEDLNGDTKSHGDPKQSDRQMPVPDRAFRLGGDPQRIDGRQKKQQDLYRERHIPRGTGIIRTGRIKPEQNGPKEIEDHDHRFKAQEKLPRPGEEGRESVFLSEVRDHISRPEHDRRGHREKMQRGIGV